MIRQIRSATLFVILLLFANTGCQDFSGQGNLSWLRSYNIVWTTPGGKALHSMPVGGGNISLNVWTTQEELLFYIGSSDSWTDGNIPGEVANVKISRVRLNISPNPFGRDFIQELDLATNSIRVSGKTEDGSSVNLKVWVDAFNPVIHVEGDASDPVNATVQLETWRGDARFGDNSVIWSHRNEGPSRARSASISRQGIQSIESAVPDPIKNLTFGGCLSGTGMVADGQSSGEHEGHKFNGWKLKTTRPVRQFDLQATLRIEQDSTIGDWEQALNDLDSVSRLNVDRDRRNTEEWWRNYWDRSHIVINSGKPENDPAWQVGRNYQLFRAMLGSNRNGKMPTLFNGGAFLCEADPDKRQWGQAGFTAQNQRLVYWPMLKSGDFDLLGVALDFYAQRLPVERAWAKHFWDVDGAVYPEDIDVFGMTVRLARKDGTCTPECLQYHWTSGMEFAMMMLDTWSYKTSDIKAYIPVATNMLHFYNQFYRKQNLQNTGSELDPEGHLVIYPGNGLEVYSGAKNDAAALSGLMALSDGLLALPAEMLTPAERDFCRDFRSHLPPLPTRTWNGHLCLSPAETWAKERLDSNMELPQLYPVFPFRYYGIGYPDLELARNTWLYGFTDASKQKPWFCWYQGGIFTACLGLTDETREYLLAKFLHPSWPAPGGKEAGKEQAARSLWKLHWIDTPGWEVPRYPAFWDCMDFDQRPDMDHGGAGMIQLQEMLMQTAGNKIILLPAWPEEWNVDFKLHAPGNTIVECVYINGKIQTLKITPETRKTDILIRGKDFPSEYKSTR